MPDAPLIEAHDLTKRYGEFVAVDGIDFSVERGETFGFLGPNGAGKSSTMRMIGAVSPASGGTLRVLGRDPERDGPEIRSRLGVVPQDDNLDLELDVGENLHVYGRFFGLPRDEIRRRTDELLEFVHLADRRESRVDSLSGGMKRRLTIARALINEPELMLLDEPTTGLDPQARHALWDRLYRLKQRGVTLVLTTHYMDEAEQLCDRLVVMDRAKIVAEGSPRELIDRYVEREVVELRFGDRERRAVVRRARRPRRGAAGPCCDRHRRRGRGGGRGARARARARDGPRAPLDARGRLPPAHGSEPDRLMDSVRRTVAVVGWQAHSFRRLWRGSITTSFLNPIFFLVSIGVLLGSLIDESNPNLGGLSYLQFVAPALLATTAMQTAASVTTFPVRAGLKWLRTYHAAVSTPIRVGELVAGILAWCGVRVIVAVTIFAVVAAIGGAFVSPLAVLAPFAALLCGLAFGSVLAAITSSVEGDEWLAAIFRFGLVPLFLFSGTFFPISQLPLVLEALAWATPLWHGVALCRSLATDDIDPLLTAVHVAYLVALTAVGAALTVRAQREKLRR